MKIVVTGTDTDIGKTVFAAGLADFLGARYWKPVQAGLEEATDSEVVSALAPGALVHPEAYRLATPASPHLAARIEGVVIDPARLRLPEGDAPLVVEGAGGALVPLAGGLLYADLFAGWGLPVVVVARTGLGTINHTLLTIEALRARAATIAGIAFVGERHEENEAVIPMLSGVARLGRLPVLADLAVDTLSAAFDEGFAEWAL